MRLVEKFIPILLFFCSLLSVANAQKNDTHFLQNKGQLADNQSEYLTDILFYTQGNQFSKLLRKQGFSYILQKDSVNNEDTTRWSQRIDINFAFSNPNITVETSRESSAYYNFFYGHCPQGVTNVRAYEVITYKNVWPNIDVKFYHGTIKGHLGQGFEYDFIVHPGGDPENIILEYKGMDV
jgi:hypothetical protein